jgi:hypothetical protein
MDAYPATTLRRGRKYSDFVQGSVSARSSLDDRREGKIACLARCEDVRGVFEVFDLGRGGSSNQSRPGITVGACVQASLRVPVVQGQPSQNGPNRSARCRHIAGAAAGCTGAGGRQRRLAHCPSACPPPPSRRSRRTSPSAPVVARLRGVLAQSVSEAGKAPAAAAARSLATAPAPCLSRLRYRRWPETARPGFASATLPAPRPDPAASPRLCAWVDPPCDAQAVTADHGAGSIGAAPDGQG